MVCIGERCFWEEVISELWPEVAQMRAFQAEGVAWAGALRWEVKKHG